MNLLISILSQSAYDGEHAFEPGYTKYVFASNPPCDAGLVNCANGVTHFNLSKKHSRGAGSHSSTGSAAW